MIFTKKPVATAKAAEPAFEQLGATDRMRRMLIAKARRRSMLAIASDLNDAAGERANRELAKDVARNMIGLDASPDVITALAKTTFANLPASNVKIISAAALESFADGSDMLSNEAKTALCEYLFDGYHTIDLATDRLKPTRSGEPVLSGIPPDRYRNPNPEIASAYEALHKAIARAAQR